MADVATNIDGKVTTDGARSRGQGVGSSKDGATSLDDILTLPNGSNDRTRGHVLHEAREERLGLEVSVVLGQKLLTRLNHLKGNQSVATVLKTAQNVGNKATLDAVGLDHNEGLFVGHFRM